MKQSDYFKSQEFKDSIKTIIEKDTWDKGLPKIYVDKEGRLIEHFKDGTIYVRKK